MIEAAQNTITAARTLFRRLSGHSGLQINPEIEVQAASRLYVLPTRYGLLFLPVLLGMLIGAINYNNNLVFILTFLLGGLTIINMLHAHIALAGMVITSIQIPPVFAGQTTTITLWYRQASSIPACYEARRPNAAVLSFSTPDSEEHKFLIPFQPPARGVHVPGRLKIQTTWPGGLFRAWSWISIQTPTLVYPRPINGPPGDHELHQTTGGAGEGRPQPGSDDFFELRPWQPTDPRRHIAWKASARLSQTLTKTFQQSQAQDSLLFDFDVIRLADLEMRLSRLCGLVLWACQQGQPWTLRLPGNTIGPAKDELHFRRCLQALALYQGPPS